MSTDLTRRALAIGLRTLADELDAGALDVEQLLAVVAPAPPLKAEPPAAVEPEQPRPQRRARPPKPKTKAKPRPKAKPKRSRPRPAPPAEEPEPEEPAEEPENLREEEDGPEARKLVDLLFQACGSLTEVSQRFGLATPSLLGRWSSGAVPCSPANLERLRQAVGELGRPQRPEAFRSGT